MLSDAADEMVLEAALNGKAQAIVTHNVKDFSPARKLGVTVATPADIVTRLKKWRRPNATNTRCTCLSL